MLPHYDVVLEEEVDMQIASSENTNYDHVVKNTRKSKELSE